MFGNRRFYGFMAAGVQIDGLIEIPVFQRTPPLSTTGTRSKGKHQNSKRKPKTTCKQPTRGRGNKH